MSKPKKVLWIVTVLTGLIFFGTLFPPKIPVRKRKA